MRVRFTVRRMMAAVAVAALASLAVVTVFREVPNTGQRVAILVGCVVAGAYGLWAMHRPLISLVYLPLVFASGSALGPIFGLTAEGCCLAWVIGAPAGWISRCLSHPAPDTPGPPP